MRKTTALALVLQIAGTFILAFYGFPATWMMKHVMIYTMTSEATVMSWLGTCFLGGGFLLQLLTLFVAPRRK